MSIKKVVYGLYDDDDILLSAVKKIKKDNINIDEVYTPFPVHGLDHALGLKKTNISNIAFVYGLTGLSFAIFMTWYIMIYDWPQDIGGKPSFTWFENMPSFVPVMFELTVFFTAHLMCITYFIRCGLYPGAKAQNPDPRTTDDKFMVEIAVNGNEETVKSLLANTGAIEVTEKEI